MAMCSTCPSRAGIEPWESEVTRGPPGFARSRPGPFAAEAGNMIPKESKAASRNHALEQRFAAARSPVDEFFPRMLRISAAAQDRESRPHSEDEYSYSGHSFRARAAHRSCDYRDSPLPW